MRIAAEVIGVLLVLVIVIGAGGIAMYRSWQRNPSLETKARRQRELIDAIWDDVADRRDEPLADLIAGRIEQVRPRLGK